jgi:hypothetical protein
VVHRVRDEVRRHLLEAVRVPLSRELALGRDRDLAPGVSRTQLVHDAPDAATFWKNLCERRYSITDQVPPERWSVEEYYDPDPSAPEKTYSKIGGWVRGYAFDWQRYKVPPRVAAA